MLYTFNPVDNPKSANQRGRRGLTGAILGPLNPVFQRIRRTSTSRALPLATRRLVPIMSFGSNHCDGPEEQSPESPWIDLLFHYSVATTDLEESHSAEIGA